MFDFATIAGLIIGLAVVTIAILTGSDIAIFFNIPGLLIVFGGTFAATMVRFPLSGVFVAMPVGMKAAFLNDKQRPRDYIEQAITLSKRARKHGHHVLEKNDIRNPFYKKGVQMVADGRDLEYVRKILTQEMAAAIQEAEIGAKVYQAIGEAAPAFGMFGTLVGLVQMLAGMNDPTSIGPAMAVALLTTLYGVLIANLIALPVADKLERRSEQDKANRALIIECVFQIQQLQNPTAMREILEPFLPEKHRQDTSREGITLKEGRPMLTKRKATGRKPPA